MAQQRMNVQAPIERLFANRWSTRAFCPHKPVSAEQLATCLEAARWAPSCFGEEPWHFIVANRFEDEGDWQNILAYLAEKNKLWAKHAPVLIVAVANPLFSHNGNPNRWAEYDTGQAAICMCLQAEALGLSSHQMGGFDPEALKHALAIPERMHVMSVTAVGHAGDAEAVAEDFRAMEINPRTRKPQSDTVHAGRWDSSWSPPASAGWEARYQETETEQLPWFLSGLDADFEQALKTLHITGGQVLDMGCGTGTQSVALAKLGHWVSASDISPTAIKSARNFAQTEGVSIDFQVDDVLDSHLTGPFDLILDRGCFHCICGIDRETYMDMVQRLLAADGRLLLKVFSHLETGENGPPNRYSAEDITQLFSSRFNIESITESVFHGNMEYPAQALFCMLRRTTQGSQNE